MMVEPGTRGTGAAWRVLAAALLVLLVAGCRLEPNEGTRRRPGGTVTTVGSVVPETHLIDLETRWLEAAVADDRATLEQLFADELVMTGVDGEHEPMDRAALLDLYTGPMRLDSFRIYDEGVDVGEYTALVRYGLEWYGAFGDEPWVDDFRMADLWVLRDGRWQLVSRVGRSVMEPPGE